MSLLEVEKFFRCRFRNAQIKGRALHVEQVDETGKVTGTKPVPYWGCVRNTVEKLDLKAAASSVGADTDYVKNLMSRAAVMEVVPFKSNQQCGVDEAFHTCMNGFTRYLLPHVVASIVVLVGKKVRQAFLDFALTETDWGKAKEAFDDQRIYHHKVSGNSKPKLVIAVDSSHGRFSIDGFPASTLAELQAEF
jgi:hypothetical protein